MCGRFNLHALPQQLTEGLRIVVAGDYILNLVEKVLTARVQEDGIVQPSILGMGTAVLGDPVRRCRIR